MSLRAACFPFAVILYHTCFYLQSEAITEEYVVEQMFVAQYDRLESIRIFLLNESAGEEFHFVLRDASRNILMQHPADCLAAIDNFIHPL